MLPTPRALHGRLVCKAIHMSCRVANKTQLGQAAGRRQHRRQAGCMAIWAARRRREHQTNRPSARHTHPALNLLAAPAAWGTAAAAVAAIGCSRGRGRRSALEQPEMAGAVANDFEVLAQPAVPHHGGCAAADLIPLASGKDVVVVQCVAVRVAGDGALRERSTGGGKCARLP